MRSRGQRDAHSLGEPRRHDDRGVSLSNPAAPDQDFIANADGPCGGAVDATYLSKKLKLKKRR